MSLSECGADLLPAAHPIGEWRQALDGVPEARERWRVEAGGRWHWRDSGVAVEGTGTEWASLVLPDPAAAEFWAGPRNFVVEVTVSGKVEAAGFSFGNFKDFLADLATSPGRHRLQLEVDLDAGTWAFRVDGRLQKRCWWDSAVRGTDDLIGRPLALKARHAEDARFEDLTVHAFESSCRLSVIMTCYRFCQRLRVTLRNWCHQTLPSGAYEVLVVNPGSPDGTHEHLAAVANSYPHVRVREVSVEPSLLKNKGAMINRAVGASRGDWIWLTDADCLFSPASAVAALDRIKDRTPRLFFGKRYYLGPSQTDQLLTGRVDGLHDFDALARSASPRGPEDSPWGYTQIVHRSTMLQVPYREEFNHFAHTDGLFIQDCLRRRILSERVEGLFCLHLDHPFSWYGTDVFL
jgi:hypothetical protein